MGKAYWVLFGPDFKDFFQEPLKVRRGLEIALFEGTISTPVLGPK